MDVSKLVEGMINLWAFGISGILLMYIGFWLFDKLTPRIDSKFFFAELGKAFPAIGAIGDFDEAFNEMFSTTPIFSGPCSRKPEPISRIVLSI